MIDKFKMQVKTINSSLNRNGMYKIELQVSSGNYRHLFVFYRTVNHDGLFKHKCMYSQSAKQDIWTYSEVNEMFHLDGNNLNLCSSSISYWMRKDAIDRRSFLSDRCKINFDELIRKMNYLALSIV